MLNDRELRAVAKVLKDYAVMQREELSNKLEAAIPPEIPEGGANDVGSPSSS